MPSMDLSNNLLAGLLAYQNGFVSREDLVRAIQAIANGEKPTTLIQWLLDTERLSTDEAQLLSALLERLLARHGGDVGQSLASLSSIPSSLRDELEQLPESNLAETLSVVRIERSSAGEADRNASAGVSVGTATSSGERFTILRAHARGGLGQVMVARDRELNREVAVKEIQSRHAKDVDHRQRFLLEAEVTGGLEHPGIVPVYSLGTYDDGRPFYAMRFVRGASLQEAIAEYYAQADQLDPQEKRLRMRQLLGRFTDVCNAIAYAHSRGVLHRDLKPGNIMLGKYGETLVVDWGLAKPAYGDTSSKENEPPLKPASGSGSLPTLAGSAIGTPAYMSPEQAAGKLEELGPASDVYSLGATLYTVLTGQPPLKGNDVVKILEQVKAGDFAHPRQVAANVPRPLEAICLRAMALSPQDRYSDPRELAEEIERWMADERVSAHRESIGERLSRLTRRYRAASQAAAAALVLITIVSLMALFMVSAARRSERVALQQERTAKDKLGVALAAETDAREQAEAALAAERVARAQARQAVDNYVEIVNDEALLKDERWQTLRQRLLRDALRYYQDLVAQSEDKPDAQWELALALLEIGRINQASGSLTEAGDSFQRAVDVLAQVNHTDRDEELFQRGRAWQNLGVVAQRTGDPPGALQSWQKALDIRRELVERHPGDPKYAVPLASNLSNLGVAKMRSGAPEEAIKTLLEAAEDLEKVAEAHPESAEIKEQMVSLYLNLGAIYGSMRKADEIVQWSEKARGVYEQLVASDPDNAEFQEGLASTLYNLSFAYQDQPEKARQLLDDAMQIQERLVELHPHVLIYRHLLGRTCQNYGVQLYTGGDKERGRALIDRARGLFESLVEEHPDAVDYLNDLTVSLTVLATLAGDAGDIELQRSYHVETIATVERLIEESPNIIEYRWRLATNYDELADLYREDQPLKAAEYYRLAIDAVELAVERFPTRAELRDLLARGHARLGMLAKAHPEVGDAVEFFTESARIYEALVEESPDKRTNLINVTGTLNNLANALIRADKSEETDGLLERAEEYGRRAVRLYAENTLARDYLGKTYTIKATVARLRGQHEKAIEQLLMRRELWPNNGQQLYVVAREIAMSIPRTADDKPQLSADEDQQREKWTGLSIQVLSEAVDQGFNDWDYLRADETLGVLHSDPRFQQLLKREPPEGE